MKRVQKKYSDLPADELVKIICRAAQDNKAKNLVVLAVKGDIQYCGLFCYHERHLYQTCSGVGRCG